ncbi:hypothetical protein AB1Y20_007166 [Prymnesium parvum]|uniref:Calpain catalytic domain-containing protein n=1 Tax=Prymnesium parvum TaxID=97485 RepID=A0AB34IXP0_PRYPA
MASALTLRPAPAASPTHVKPHHSSSASQIVCGTYLRLQTLGRFSEPNYCDVSSRLYLYQRAPREWVISSRRGGAAHRASCAAASPFGAHTWRVFTGAAWADVRLAAAPHATHAPPAAPAPALIVSSRRADCSGLYLLRLPAEGSARYDCREKGTMLYRQPRGRGGAWLICAAAADAPLAVSAGGAASPEAAEWGEAQLSVYRVAAEERLIRAEEEERGQWVDPAFPASAESIGEGLMLSNKARPLACVCSGSGVYWEWCVLGVDVRWVRGPALLPPSELPQLFNRIEPDDILQGALGDCWLLAAIAAVAEFPEYIAKHLFITQTIDGEDVPGKYRLRLYDGARSEWQEIEIDDRIPCIDKGWFDTPTPLFAKNNGAELYVMLLEKAFAKVSGSYSVLKGGASSRAWLAMTGCADINYYDFDDFSRRWVESKLDTSPEVVPFTNWSRKLLRAGQLGFKREAQLGHDQMFTLLREADEKNFLMGASIGGLGVESKRPDGLVEGHAYSLIRVVRIDPPDGEALQLVELRNPWGNQQEWRGAWSDRSAEWQKHRHVARQLKPQVRADGLFWMSWEDFARIFTNIEICRKSMPSKRASFEQLAGGFSSRHSPQECHAAGIGVGNFVRPPAKSSSSGAKQTGARMGFQPILKPRPPISGTTRLKKPVITMRYPLVEIEPVTEQPDAPFSQYLKAHARYLEACAAYVAA